MRVSLPADSPSDRAFSLVEMLVVIAVIGILCAIAIPAFNGVRESARINTNQRNAQSLAAAAGAAQAAGAVLDLSSREAAIAQLKQGLAGAGPLATSTFRVAPFNAEQIEGFLPYLEIRNDCLVYESR